MKHGYLEVMKRQFGENNYLGMHRGRASGRPHYLFLTADGDQRFQIDSYTMSSDGEILKSGYYVGQEVTDTVRDPRGFMARPIIPYRSQVFFSNIETFFRGDGVSHALFEALLHELEGRQCLHVAGFTRDGVAIMKKKYEHVGYDRCVLIDKNVPEKVSFLNDWLYKDYS